MSRGELGSLPLTRRIALIVMILVPLAACAGTTPEPGQEQGLEPRQDAPQVPFLPPDTLPSGALRDSIFSPENMVSDPRLGGQVPRNIVFISFNAEATQAQRQKAIDLVDGEVLGGVRIHDGGWYYVRITDDGTAQSLLDALDRLESLPQVRIASPQLPEGVPGSAVPRVPFELQHTDEQAARLRSDAVALAARLIERSEDPPEQLPVSPPPTLIDSIHGSLVSIFELEHPARDSVFEMHEIHAVASGLYSAIVGVDSLTPWLKAWTLGQTETGIAGIDSILGPLVVRSIEEQELAIFGDRDFVLQFEVPVNWYVLRQRLVSVSGIEEVVPGELLIGGGDHLVLERTAKGWRFRFSVAWGDCLAGCLNRHDWIFRVNDRGEARFVGSFGDPLPMGRAEDSL